MRITENEQLALGVDDRFKVIEVHFVVGAVPFERIMYNLPTVTFGDGHERCIDRSLYDDFISGVTKYIDCQAYALDNPGNIGDPFSFYFPAMQVVEPIDNGLPIARRSLGISVNRVL